MPDTARKPPQRATLAQWVQAAAKSAPQGNLAGLDWHTPDGIVV